MSSNKVDHQGFTIAEIQSLPLLQSDPAWLIYRCLVVAAICSQPSKYKFEWAGDAGKNIRALRLHLTRTAL